MQGFISDIFQITYFLPLDNGNQRQVVWKVGQPIGDGKIHEIMYDENYLKTYKKQHRIIIYVKSKSEVKAWKNEFIPLDSYLSLNEELN